MSDLKRNTRVRYKVNPSTGAIESTQSYLGLGGVLFKVLISRGESGYTLTVGGSGVDTVSLSLPTLARAKSMAKSVLVEQGVVFYDDVRNKVLTSASG